VALVAGEVDLRIAAEDGVYFGLGHRNVVYRK
jgi:hypothetical protein